METLNTGEHFPTLEARATDGSTRRIPNELHDHRVAVLLFYRGHW